MCFRAQFTSKLTRSGIRDFQRYLWVRLDDTATPKAGEGNTATTWHEPRSHFPHLALSLLYWFYSYPLLVSNTAFLIQHTLSTHSYHHPTHPDHDPNQAGKNCDKLGSKDHQTSSFALAWLKMKCDNLGEESQFRTHSKNYFSKFPWLIESIPFFSQFLVYES